MVVQESRLLSRTLKRPLLDVDAWVGRLGFVLPFTKGMELNRVPFRPFAIVEYLDPGGAASSQTGEPPDSNEWASANQGKLLSVMRKLEVLAVIG